MECSRCEARCGEATIQLQSRRQRAVYKMIGRLAIYHTSRRIRCCRRARLQSAICEARKASRRTPSFSLSTTRFRVRESIEGLESIYAIDDSGLRIPVWWAMKAGIKSLVFLSLWQARVESWQRVESASRYESLISDPKSQIASAVFPFKLLHERNQRCHPFLGECIGKWRHESPYRAMALNPQALAPATRHRISFRVLPTAGESHVLNERESVSACPR